jgi:hypothetical protein
MNLRPALSAVLMAVVASCSSVVLAQQGAPASIPPVPVDTTEAGEIAHNISLRSEHMKPMFDQVHIADWIAKGAPEAYTSQWNSLVQQNLAIQADMAALARRAAAPPDSSQQESILQESMKAIFRVQRFDRDLDALLNAIRRYQNPALADLIESVAAGDQSGLEKLESYVLEVANEKERQLDVVDREAQRCRSTLANQPPVRPAPPKPNVKTTK